MSAAPTTIRADDLKREDGAWLTRREQGTVLGISAAYYLATLFGRWPIRVLVFFLSLYYVWAKSEVRRASSEYLALALGRPAKFLEVCKHVRAFAQVTADRIFFLRGKTQSFAVTRTGNHYMHELQEQGRGAILLGAHVGSFEALRMDGEEINVPINILGHFANARMINALFERVNPDISAKVIHIEPGSVDFIFQVQQAIERGEFVGTMGDRVGLNEKSVTVQFFGRPARFPIGPFVLASALKCPVFLTFGLYSAPARYDLFCEPFAERVSLPRKERQAYLHKYVQDYASKLEALCRRFPYNWFNFYPFWDATNSHTVHSISNDATLTKSPQPR